MKIDEQMKLFNAELDKVKKLIPNINCSQVYTCRTMPLSLVYYIEIDEQFMGYYDEDPKLVADRLLKCYEYLVLQFNDVITALKEVIDE